MVRAALTFRQQLDADGWQQEAYPDLNPHLQPLTRLEGREGEPITVEVPLASTRATAQVWIARAGRHPDLGHDLELGLAAWAHPGDGHGDG